MRISLSLLILMFVACTTSFGCTSTAPILEEDPDGTSRPDVGEPDATVDLDAETAPDVVALPDGTADGTADSSPESGDSGNLPSRLTGLSSPTKTKTSITLTWNESPAGENVISYSALRGLGDGGGNPAADPETQFEEEIGGPPFGWDGLSPGQEYYFRVAAVSADGQGPWTSRIFVTTETETIPGGMEPASVTAISTFESQPLGAHWPHEQWPMELGGNMRPSMSGGNSVESNPRRAVFVNSPTYTGNRAVEYFIPGNNTGGDGASFRSEHSISGAGTNRDQANWEGLVHYVGLAVRLDPGFPTTLTTSSTIIQLHTVFSEPDHSPVWALRVAPNGNWRLTGKTPHPETGNNVHWTQNILPYAPDIGQWVRWTFAVKYHPTDGYIHVYRNGVLVASKVDYESFPHNNSVFGYYKMGLYASNYKSISGPDLKIVIDDLRIADETGSLSAVDPATYRP